MFASYQQGALAPTENYIARTKTYQRYALLNDVGQVVDLAQEVGAVSPLPPQIDFTKPNPFANTKVELSLDPSARFVDYDLVLRKKAFKEFGAYDQPGPSRKPLPILTPAMVLDYTQWMLDENERLERTHGLKQELALLNLLKENRAEIIRKYDDDMAKAGVSKGSARHTLHMRTTIVPFNQALRFWQTARAQVIRMDSSSQAPGLLGNLKMLAESFWEAAKEVVKTGGSGALKLLKQLIKVLKVVAIVIGVGAGVWLIASVIGAATH